MKKILIIGAFITVLSLSSCIKDRTCICETSYFGYSEYDSVIIEDANKKDATTICEQKSTDYPGDLAECELE